MLATIGTEPSLSAVFCVGVATGDQPEDLVGVAMVGIPKARMLMDGATLEVTRTCTDGSRNANSMLYGACARAAKALGYKALLTYTLPEESGVSLRAAGWKQDEGVYGGDATAWSRHTRSPGRGDIDLFGNVRIPQGPKLRWRKDL